MGPIEAFNATWSQARATMGEGAPQDGSALDNSAQLRQMQSQVQAAAPGERWTGAAADAYADANDGQARRLGQLAELDQQLAAEVSRSAQAVTAGRQNLDSIQQWVNEAAASLPESGDPEQQLPIARKGISEVADVVRQTHGELNTIGARIRTIGNEYRQLDDFNLDTQYARPAGLPGGAPAPEGTVDMTIALTGPVTGIAALTQTKTLWTQPGGSKGRHCK